MPIKVTPSPTPAVYKHQVSRLSRIMHGVQTRFITVLLTAVLTAGSAVGQSPSGCTFLTAPGTTPAFCETFDQPAGIGNRSGDLNGTLWGVSRLLGSINSGQHQFYDAAPFTLNKCGQMVSVQPENDVTICNGQLIEGQYDQTGVTNIAIYPKQPFDIAGRTGIIAFDVSDDTEGNHTAWPELWYTDQPVPDPAIHESPLQSTPRNGFVIRFGAFCPANVPGCGIRFICPDEPANVPVITVDSAAVITNYASNDSFDPVGSISVKPVGCVKKSSGLGDMNHFELHVSQNEIDVYGTDAGTSGPLRKLAIITNAPLTLTRGLVWMEDVHYNGNKGGDQGTHTFSWDNFAFDGPVLPRDLAFDVLDNNELVGPSYPGLVNLGWPTVPNTPLTLTVPGVYNIANANGAILTFNYAPTNPVTVTYRVNNGAWQSQPWPFGACYTQNNTVMCGEKTIAVPVPLSDVQPGTNTIQIQTSDYAAVANVDLILLGAAGISGGCAPNCPVSTATTLASSSNPASAGNAITLTATVTASKGVPTGTVTFSDSGTPLGSGTLNASGVATFTTSSLTVGTHMLTAFYSGASGFISSQSAALSEVVNQTAPVVRFDWETGTLEGWQVAWGKSVAISNSTAEAFTGTHSLLIAVAAAETHAAVDFEVNPQVAGVGGITVTLHVFNQGVTGAVVYPFSYNEVWLPNFGAGVTLQAGWNTVTYVIPKTFVGVHGIGMQINNPGAKAGNLYLDTVTTQ